MREGSCMWVTGYMGHRVYGMGMDMGTYIGGGHKRGVMHVGHRVYGSQVTWYMVWVRYLNPVPPSRAPGNPIAPLARPLGNTLLLVERKDGAGTRGTPGAAGLTPLGGEGPGAQAVPRPIPPGGARHAQPPDGGGLPRPPVPLVHEVDGAVTPMGPGSVPQGLPGESHPRPTCRAR